MLPDDITFDDKYDPILRITEQSEADAYFEACVCHSMRFGKDRKEAEAVERCNIGYWSGYYGHETMIRIQRLFKCQHPIFGPADEVRPPTIEEALELGKQIGRQMIEGTYPPMRGERS